MEKLQPETFIASSERLTRLFGYWPTFHDAEILEISLWRGELKPDDDLYVFPTLTVRIHLWELTDQTDDDGSLKQQKHTLVVLKFYNIEAVTVRDFNYLNTIEELRFSIGATEPAKSSNIKQTPVLVEFVESFGVSARFTCVGVEVVSAVRWDERDNV
jgi:hypothetical protein